MKCDKITKDNLELAITIQNTIFPEENGALNLKASVDNSLNDKAYGKNSGRSVYYWLCKNEKDEVVGITGMYSYAEYPNDSWCAWFGILPVFQRRGYGKELFLWTMEEAKRMGFENFRLYTDLVNNETAVSLYRKVGMVEESYVAEDMGDEKIVIFSKSLISDNSEPFGNKMLFLKKQEEIQARANFDK